MSRTLLIPGVDGDCTAYVTLSNLRGDLVSDGDGVLVLRLGDWIRGGGDEDLATNEGDVDRFAVDWNPNGSDCTINDLNSGGGDTIEKTCIGGNIWNSGSDVLASSSISYNEKKDWH